MNLTKAEMVPHDPNELKKNFVIMSWEDFNRKAIEKISESVPEVKSLDESKKLATLLIMGINKSPQHVILFNE